QGAGGVTAARPRRCDTLPRTRGRSVVVAQKPSKLLGRVRFPSPALSAARSRRGYDRRSHGEWRSLVAHPAGGRAVAGSNPVSPIRGLLVIGGGGGGLGARGLALGSGFRAALTRGAHRAPRSHLRWDRPRNRPRGLAWA